MVFLKTEILWDITLTHWLIRCNISEGFNFVTSRFHVGEIPLSKKDRSGVYFELTLVYCCSHWRTEINHDNLVVPLYQILTGRLLNTVRYGSTQPAAPSRRLLCAPLNVINRNRRVWEIINFRRLKFHLGCKKETRNRNDEVFVMWNVKWKKGWCYCEWKINEHVFDLIMDGTVK
jgi:hypothetical protein